MDIESNTAKIDAVVQSAIQQHGATREALVPILSDVNRAFGYIPNEAYKAIRQQIMLPDQPVYVTEGQLHSVASFYHMLSTKPRGRHVVWFCESAPCHVVGGRELMHALKTELDLEPGETSPDNRWTFLTTSCLGVCAVGPVVVVDEDIYGNVSPADLPEILEKYA
jgi:NADH-quinone oxidoreductase subunit E